MLREEAAISKEGETGPVWRLDIDDNGELGLEDPTGGVGVIGVGSCKPFCELSGLGERVREPFPVALHLACVHMTQTIDPHPEAPVARTRKTVVAYRGNRERPDVKHDVAFSGPSGPRVRRELLQNV